MTLAGAFVALLVWGVLTAAPDGTIDDGLAQGRPAPAPGYQLEVLQRGRLGDDLDARLAPALADGQLAARELRGVPHVLNFWASWCVPCREEAPILQAGWEEGRRRGILFVGLDMQDVGQDARDFLADFALDYLNIRDRDDTVARRYGLAGIPETYFISAHGEVVGHVIGAITPPQLRAGMAAAATGRPAPTAAGGAQRSTR
ncbi:MAG TPA: TlpA disulfide reductase family protein [Solirubrobacteraceae bacterium]|nr:TlpA disulfide reductase family protein [Solirubrobacteraceae bacterium]